MATFATESVIDEIARTLGMDPIELRLKNAVVEGDQAPYGPKYGPIGLKAGARGGAASSALAGAARSRIRDAASPAASGSTPA